MLAPAMWSSTPTLPVPSLAPSGWGSLLLALLAFLVPAPLRAEPSQPLGHAIELKGVQVDPGFLLDDVRGLKVDFSYRVGRVDTEKVLDLVVHATTRVGERTVTTVTGAVFGPAACSDANFSMSMWPTAKDPSSAAVRISRVSAVALCASSRARTSSMVATRAE